jgi:hypothetical protein
MRKAGALVLLSAACTVSGPKLVSVPMLDAVPTTTGSITPGTPSEDDDPTLDELSGSWTGRAWQAGKSSWPLAVTFDKPHNGEVVAHVQYSDQRCSGEWRLRSGSPKLWQGDEKITIDTLRRCADHGKITIEVLEEDSLKWKWAGSGGSASATLERTQH